MTETGLMVWKLVSKLEDGDRSRIKNMYKFQVSTTSPVRNKFLYGASIDTSIHNVKRDVVSVF